MEIVLNTPYSYILLCLAAGFLYSYLLYAFRNKARLSFPVNYILPVFRFLSVTIICFLLLSPLLKTLQQSIEKPLIVIAHDNSQSVLLNPDSAFYKGIYLDEYNSLVTKLSGKFDVRTYTFGSGFTPDGELDFSENLTDMSGMLDEVSNRFYHRNLGALLLAGDGLYNHGSNPLHSISAIDAPVFCIALGDTSLQRDLIVRRLVYNKVAFAGNSFPLEIQIAANRCRNERSVLSVSSEGNILYSKDITPDSDEFQFIHTISLQAGEAGVKRFRVALSPLQGEISLENNYSDFYIEVLENRLKVAIIGLAPHPDMSAMRYALESNINYEVESFLAKDFNKPASAYNLVVLHQLPSVDRQHNALVESIRQAGIPVLFVVGNQSGINNLNAMRTGVSMVVKRQGFNESLAVYEPSFTLFGLSRSSIDLIESMPPLISHFADYRLSNAVNVLFRQRIGRVNTTMPLISFFDDAGYRSGVIFGEGIWKWRLHSFAKNQSHEAFNELINKIAQYLSLKADRDFFRVYGENVFTGNRAIEFFAELYNDNYELINDPDVSFVIRNSEGKHFDYSFSRRENDYSLNAGIFPPGDYSWEAKVQLGNRKGEKSGRFSISEILAEKIRTRADHSLMHQIADLSDGEVFYPRQLDELYNVILQRDDIKPLYRSRKKLSELIDFKWIFVLILVLLTIEWIFRKRYGTY